MRSPVTSEGRFSRRRREKGRWAWAGAAESRQLGPGKQLENNHRDPKASAGKLFSNCFCHQCSTHLLILGSHTRPSNGNSHVSVCVRLSGSV